MDKQNTPTKYVRITKSHDRNVWYKDRIGMIYPVVDATDEAFQLNMPYSSLYIQKSDCEPYEFPTLSTDSEDEKTVHERAEEYAKKEYPIASRRELDLAAKDYRKGYEYAYPLGFERGFKQAQRNLPVQEGHTITTEQLKDLYESLGEYSPEAGRELLAKIFPTVFKQERTYKIGSEFSNSEFPDTQYVLVHIWANKVGLLCDGAAFWACDGRKEVHEVADPDSITEEEFRRIIGLKAHEQNVFTLLPDTTDQMV